MKKIGWAVLLRTAEIRVPHTIEGAFAQGALEMIVVLPDSRTAHNGSMYSSSVTTPAPCT